MASKTGAVITKLRTSLATVTGLTGDGAVVVGIPPQGKPQRVPCAYLWVESVESTTGSALSMFRRDLMARVQVYVSATTRGPETRTIAAYDMLDLVVEALEADRTLSTANVPLVYDLKVSAAAVDGDEMGMSGLLVIGAEIACWWEVESGGGL